MSKSRKSKTEDGEDLVIHRWPAAFGDFLQAARFVEILTDQGIAAKLWTPKAAPGDLVLCRKHESEVLPSRNWHFRYEPETNWDGRSIMRKALDNFAAEMGLDRQLAITRSSASVAYHDIKSIPAVDLTLCTRSGQWSPYRNWPYFDELKALLSRAGYSWQDITDETGIACLNWAAKSKLYVGLETGQSHYVAPVIAKGFIIQSGYSNVKYWMPDIFDWIGVKVACANCFMGEDNDCNHGHMCMRSISAGAVFNCIEQLLGKDRRQDDTRSKPAPKRAARQKPHRRRKRH